MSRHLPTQGQQAGVILTVMNRFIEQQIMNILLEAESSKGFGRGRYKNVIDALPKALADTQPKKLMQRLGVGKIEPGSDIVILEKFLNQVIAAEGAEDDVMSEVYTDIELSRDDNKLQGIKVQINAAEVPLRDASRFMVHALHAAEKSTYANWTRTPYVENIGSGNQFLIYFADKPESWSEGKKKNDSDKKIPPPSPSKDKGNKK